MSKWIKCDSCSAQALWVARSIGGELYFCGHHKNKNAEALEKWAYEMVELLKEEQLVKAE